MTRAERRRDRLSLAPYALAVWVGHSMGAAVAREAARLAPDRTAGLVLVDGSLYTPERAAARRPLADRFEGPGGRSERRRIIEALFVPSTSPAVREDVLRLMLSGSDETAARAFRALTDPSAWQPGSAVTAPALAVYPDGADVPEKHLRRLFGNVEILRIANAGHFLMRERPEEFNRLVEDFLDRLAFPLAS